MADIGELVKNITNDVKVLVLGEVELAKAELSTAAKNVGAGAGLFSAAGYLLLNAVSLLFIAGALALALLVGYPLGFVIMAAVLIVIAIILAAIGYSRIKRVKGPTETVSEAKATSQALVTAVDRGRDGTRELNSVN